MAILLAILIGSSAGQIRAPAPPPVKLYILDFDNLAGSERLEWLTKALKDMVLLRLEDEPRLVGKDAGKIAPFLDKRPTAKPGVKGLAGDDLLVMGAYHREDARLVVTLQLFDMQSWTRLSSDAVEALYSDIPLINQLLVAKVLAMVDAVKFASGFTLSGQAAAVKELRTFEGMRPSPELRTEEYAARAPAVREDLERAVADLELAMDEYSGYRQETSPTVQEADRYSREFDLTGKGALPEEREQHTRLFEEVLRQVGDNPYSAEIGDLDLVVDPYDDQRVYLNIPIKYSVKEGLLEDMLYS
ncbi:MAG: hypothetical protein KAU50_10430, partial [Candidatus Marinimicrobia bacterium]|nr:hypothetical protein [Candidatus Neomarinimicrobiota bacterium]